MASVQSLHLPTFGSHGAPGPNKISKPKPVSSIKAVKPILKKWSHSEKTSLDLDRAWDDQDEQYRSQQGDDALYNSNGASRSSRDVGVAFDDVISSSTTVGGGSGSGLSGGPGVHAGSGGVGLGVSSTATGSGGRVYGHSRTVSGTSHVSSATSNSGSGARAGTCFVHPFQQTPRTSTTTPPLLPGPHANPHGSFFDPFAAGHHHSRDYSADTIDEDDADGDWLDSLHSPHLNQKPMVNPYSHSQPTLGTARRPSLANSQRTLSSTADGSPGNQVSRIITSRSNSATPAQSSRLIHVSTDPSWETTDKTRGFDSMESPNASPSSYHASSHQLNSPPTASIAAMSPLRSSFDAGSFARLRSKSDLDTATRAAQLREARRKFEMKEKAKDEKYAREEIKRRERADKKRAHEAEKLAAAVLKEQNAVRAREENAEIEEIPSSRKHHRRKISATSSGRPSLSTRPSMGGRPSMSGRPSLSRRNTPTPHEETHRFASSNYDSIDARNPPSIGADAGGARGVSFQSQRRTNSAKQKTQGTWHTFMLWLRTKLLRASRSR